MRTQLDLPRTGAGGGPPWLVHWPGVSQCNRSSAVQWRADRRLLPALAPAARSASRSAHADLCDALSGEHGRDALAEIALQHDGVAVDGATATQRLLELAAERLE